jgi:hypothetical protein
MADLPRLNRRQLADELLAFADTLQRLYSTVFKGDLERFVAQRRGVYRDVEIHIERLRIILDDGHEGHGIELLDNHGDIDAATDAANILYAIESLEAPDEYGGFSDAGEDRRLQWLEADARQCAIRLRLLIARDEPKTLNPERDAWIYRQVMRGVPHKEIIAELKRRPEWEFIKDPPGIRRAAEQYAKVHELAPPPDRKPGRPCKGSKRPELEI